VRAAGEVRERRRQASHPTTVKPELLATRPNEMWSWDITKLLGPVKWTYFYLYVIIDIYSRFVPGWLLAKRETAELAERLPADTIRKQHIVADRLTIHADRGTSMACKPVALLLADLGVTKSHSRPHCSNDNPRSARGLCGWELDCVALFARAEWSGRIVVRIDDGHGPSGASQVGCRRQAFPGGSTTNPHALNHSSTVNQLA